MSNSPLVSYTKISPNRTSPRSNSVYIITPHCYVGQCSVQDMAAWLCNSSAQASANYGIGKNGEVGMFVEEKDRSWCSSSSWNDNRAVTIECASDKTDPYAINDKVYKTLVNLMADICQRYGKKKLLWFGDKEKTLNYSPASDEMLITVHRWFASKACPGDFIYNRLGQIANEVNALLGSGTDVTPTQVDAVSSAAQSNSFYRIRKSWADSSSQVGAYVSLESAKQDCPVGYTVFDPDGKAVYIKEAKAIDINTLTGKNLSGTEAERIAMVAPIYQQVMKETGMLASVGLAQFALESYYGQTDLGLYANNMHGMKCSLSGNTWANSVWDGVSKYTKKTAEQTTSGQTYYITADFRSYPSILKSVQDRAAYFIGAWLDAAKTTKRYPNVNMIKDAETQVKLLKAGGYATDVNYVSKLMNIISRFNLTQYDQGIEPEVWNGCNVEVTVLPDVAVSYYRVAADYKDGKYISQTGAFTNKDTALASAKASNLNCYDPDGKIIYEAPKTANKKVYRVQCGRFSVKRNATNLINLLKTNGIESLLVEDGTEWIVQVGLFEKKSNAEAYAKKVKAKGFDVLIVEIEEKK